MTAIRETSPADLDFVLGLENRPDTVPWIGLWTRKQHFEAIESSASEHLVITAGGEPVGYAILLDLDDPFDAVQIKRIVVARRGEGIGTAALRLIVERAFAVHGAHRVWLDVVDSNERARRAYRTAGFVEEGTLREVWRNAEGRQSLVVLSILAPEWRSQRA